MIQWVWERAMKAKSLADVVVATDDPRIIDHVNSFGGKTVLTSNEHPSGTDRCAEVMIKLGGDYDYVINIQGDEPMLAPQQIDELSSVLDHEVEIATQMSRVNSHDELWSTGEVKIILNHRNEALYFSREVIPHLHNKPKERWHELHEYRKHVGMYAYRGDILLKLSKLRPSSLEKAESLEQLRWLEAGYVIRLVPTLYESHCVDTQADLEKVQRLMGEMGLLKS